jgi:hypothetical protein
MFKARAYQPEGIVDMATLKDAVKTRPAFGLSLPIKSMSDLMYGVRTGEIIAVGAGTGIGKTDLYTQIATHFMVEHNEPGGMFALEQSPRETATRIAGKLAGKTFHIPDSGWTEVTSTARGTRSCRREVLPLRLVRRDEVGRGAREDGVHEEHLGCEVLLPRPPHRTSSC